MGAENISMPAGGEKPPIKELPKGKNSTKTREPTQTVERANPEHPDKEIKETTPLPDINPFHYLLQLYYCCG